MFLDFGKDKRTPGTTGQELIFFPGLEVKVNPFQEFPIFPGIGPARQLDEGILQPAHRPFNLACPWA
jgi:hypothetical protein